MDVHLHRAERARGSRRDVQSPGPRQYDGARKKARNGTKLTCDLCSPETRRAGITGNGQDYGGADANVNNDVDDDVADNDDDVDGDGNDDDGDETHARGIGVERPRTTLRGTPKAPGQQPLGGIRSTMPATRNYTARKPER